MSKLGIIAGGGDLPRAVAQSARADGREIFVIGHHDCGMTGMGHQAILDAARQIGRASCRERV